MWTTTQTYTPCHPLAKLTLLSSSRLTRGSKGIKEWIPDQVGNDKSFFS